MLRTQQSATAIIRTRVTQAKWESPPRQCRESHNYETKSRMDGKKAHTRKSQRDP